VIRGVISAEAYSGTAGAKCDLDREILNRRTELLAMRVTGMRNWRGDDTMRGWAAKSPEARSLLEDRLLPSRKVWEFRFPRPIIINRRRYFTEQALAPWELSQAARRQP